MLDAVHTVEKPLIVGASGFVGRHLAQALRAQASAVRCLARNPARIQNLAQAGCEVVQGDISDLGSNVRRLIYVTYLGVTPDSPSAWVRGRWATQQFLLHSGLDVTIVQPGQITGVGGQGFDMMVSQAKKPVALMFARGKQRWRNIAIDDLIYYLIGVLNDRRTYGQCYEVGCDDILTNDQMVDLTAEVLGRRHPVKMHLPPTLLGTLAPLIERMSKLPKGSIRGIVDSMKADAIGDPKPIRKILPRLPLSYRQAVERALFSTSG